MQDLIRNIGDFFSGSSKVPANPDIAHNLLLLEETKKKIETGVFTKFFTKPTILLAEFLAYTLAVAFIVIGAYFGGKIDLLLNFLQQEEACKNILDKASFAPGTIPVLQILLYIICAMPTLIFFLLGRALTQSRKRINTFIQVENMIDRVIFNLKNEKKS